MPSTSQGLPSTMIGRSRLVTQALALIEPRWLVTAGQLSNSSGTYAVAASLGAIDDTIAKLPEAIKRQQDARYHSQGRLKKRTPNDALFRLAEETGVK